MLGALRQADEGDQRTGASQAAGGYGAPPRTLGQRAGDSGSAPLFPAPGLADLDRLLSRTASAGVRVDVTRCGQPRELPASIDLSAYRIVQEALTNVVKHARTSSCRVLIGYGHDELILEVTDNGAGLPAMAGAAASGGTVNGGGTVNSGPAMIGMSALPGWSASDDICGAGGAGSTFGGSGAGSTFGGSSAGSTFGGGHGAGSSFGGGHGAGSSFAGGHGIIGMRERVSLLGGEFSAGPLPGYGFQVSAHIPLPAGTPA